MAIPHFRATFIGSTKSPIAAAAYRHRTTMVDQSTGNRWSYRNEGDLVHSEFAIPAGSPDWLTAIHALPSNSQKSSALWNRAVACERQINEQTAREFVIALPMELGRSAQLDLMREFVETNFVSRGLVVDWVLHDKPGNPHVHLMHTLRPLTATGFGPKKIALVDNLGQIRRAPSGKIIYRDFIGNRDTLIDLRTAWAQTASRHLARAGHDVQVDLSSFASRGLKLLPTRHIGPAGAGMDRSGRHSAAVAASVEDKAITAAQIARDPGRIIALVSQQSSVFDQRDIARALHRFIDDPSRFANAYARALQHPSLVELAPASDDASGRLATPAKLATHAMIALEADLSSQACALTGSSLHRLGTRAVVAAVSRSEITLSQEQVAAVAHVTRGADLACIVGFAGAGKSTLLAVARDAWAANDHVVVGAALAGKAASGLQSASGIASRTIASWTHSWAAGRDHLTSSHVFVLDEAGMVASRDMALIMAEVSRAGAKLVLVGDPEQLQPIQAGGAFRALIEQAGAVEVAGVRRQIEPWAQDASIAFQRGKVGTAIAAYDTRGAIHFEPDRLAAAGALVDAYMAALDRSSARAQIALAHRNDDICALNSAIQQRLRVRGLLGPAHRVAATSGDRELAAGDRVLFLKNTRIEALDGQPAGSVNNGSLGSVTAIHGRDGRMIIHVTSDDGQTFAFDPAIMPEFDLGYATTIHKAQGATVERALVLASTTMDKHLAYVAMTRHRQSVHLFVPRTDIADTKALVATFSRTNPKGTTLDYAERRSIGPRAVVSLDLVPLLTRGKALVSDLRKTLEELYFNFHLRVSQSRISWYPRPDDRQPNIGSKIMDTASSLAPLLPKPITLKTVGDRTHATWIKDVQANDIAKAAGAKWSTEASSWVFDPKNPLTEPALTEIEARVRLVQASMGVVANFRHDSPTINTTVADGKLVVRSPKDPGTNAMLRDAGGDWNKRLGGYTFELPDTEAAKALKSALQSIDRHITDVEPVRDLIDRTNRDLPGINITATPNGRDGFDFAIRPPYDKHIQTILKSEPDPAAWDTASKSWKLPAAPGDSQALDSKLIDVFSRVTELKMAQGVAKEFTSLETHPLIVVTAMGPNIIVALPDDNNAGQVLNRAGFSWQPNLKAYAGIPDDDDQAERMSLAIAAAGRHLDRAILPHTPERDGIPHLNAFSAKVLHDAQEGAAQRYAREPNVKRFVDKLVDRYTAFSDEQKAAVQFKDAKAFGDITGLDHAKAAIAMNVVEAALRVQDQGRALVNALDSQALALATTQMPSRSM